MINTNILNSFGRSYNLNNWNDSEIDNVYDCQIYCLDYYYESCFDSLIFNKKGYNAFYNKVNKLHIKNAEFEAHLCYDVSGYNYWSNLQEESNYILLSIEIFNKDLDVEFMFELIEDEILTPLKEYYHFLTAHKHYLRSRKNEK